MQRLAIGDLLDQGGSGESWELGETRLPQHLCKEYLLQYNGEGLPSMMAQVSDDAQGPPSP